MTASRLQPHVRKPGRAARLARDRWGSLLTLEGRWRGEAGGPITRAEQRSACGPRAKRATHIILGRALSERRERSEQSELRGRAATTNDPQGRRKSSAPR